MKTTKQFIESTRTNWSNRLTIRQVEQIAAADDDVVVHPFETNLNDELYQALKKDTEKIHFVYDCNGYLHGINIRFFSMYLGEWARI